MDAPKSKPIIDEIDTVLARHYGFTAEELDFILNYDIKYRLGRDHRERGGMIPVLLTASDARYPARLREGLGDVAPGQISALGNLDLLALPKTALFCSARCPGHAILAAYDQAARWRDAGRCIISGFHSPVEKECLRILLRGSQPVIICPARSLGKAAPPDRLEKPIDRRSPANPLLLQPRNDAASPSNSPSAAMSSSLRWRMKFGSPTSSPAARCNAWHIKLLHRIDFFLCRSFVPCR